MMSMRPRTKILPGAPKQLFWCSSGLSLQGSQKVREDSSGDFWDVPIWRKQDPGDREATFLRHRGL